MPYQRLPALPVQQFVDGASHGLGSADARSADARSAHRAKSMSFIVAQSRSQLGK